MNLPVRVRAVPPHARWLAASLLAWVTLLGMVLTREGLAEDDRPLLGWLVQHRGPTWTAAMEVVSSPVTATVVPAAALTATLAVGLVARTWRPLATVVLATGGAAVTGCCSRTSSGGPGRPSPRCSASPRPAGRSRPTTR